MTNRMQQLFAALSYMAGHYYGKRLVLTSGDRDCKKQLEISGPNSYHLTGNAFDAIIQPYDAAQQRMIGLVAVELGFRWGGQFNAADLVHFDDGRRSSPGRCSTGSGSSFVGTALNLYTEVRDLFEALRGAIQGPGGPAQPWGNVDQLYPTGRGPISTGQEIAGRSGAPEWWPGDISEFWRT